MKRRGVMTVLAAVSALVLSACAGTNTADSQKVIRVGCDAKVPGWIQTDENGKLSGYDYDIWMEIGKRTGYTIEYQIMDWDALWVSLADKRLDTIGNQVSYTPERAEKYYMSEPYAYNVYSLLAREDNTALQSMNDLKDGMTISCEPNSTDEIVVEKIKEQYGVSLEPIFFDGMSVQEVVLGRCDVWPRSKTSCMLTVQEVDNLKILGDTTFIENDVYPFVKDEKGKQLSEMVSKTLIEMREDGTLKQLSEKWFGVDISSTAE